VYEPIAQKDLKEISLEQQKIIAKEIQKKLTIAPHIYGKPLRNVLHPWRSLRIGKYRVIFDIENENVVIWAIIPRKKGYDEVQKRR
jgi:mRNA-degrading endonuclease RelE of RelBE toxin-antitoxin system